MKTRVQFTVIIEHDETAEMDYQTKCQNIEYGIQSLDGVEEVYVGIGEEEV